ncbi:MAG: preprotein translocase subunit SecE [Candidatus Saccharibacteria bacterium]
MAIKNFKPNIKSVLKTIKPKSTNNKPMAALFAIGGYFKGSWIELKKVRWPDRRATWGMTGAVIIFTAMFVVLIVSLDWAFSQLFKLII